MSKPCWQRCDLCEDFVCNVHPGEHVYDCSCPGVEWWGDRGMSPYETTVEELEECLRKEGLSEIPHYEEVCE